MNISRVQDAVCVVESEVSISRVQDAVCVV